MATLDLRDALADPGRPVVIVEPMTPVRAMKITIGVLFVLAMAWTLWQGGSIVLLLAFGILLGAAIEPVVNRLRRHGLSRGQAILVIYAVIALAVAAGVALVAPRLFAQGQELVAGVPGYLDGLRTQAQSVGNPAVREAGLRAIARADRTWQQLSTSPPVDTARLGQAMEFLTSFVGVIFTVASVLIVAYYWMTEKAIVKRVGLGLFPLDRRDRAHAIWNEIEDRLGGWARGQLLLMAIIGVASTAFYGAIGLPFWFLLGIWAGLTEAIPFVGPYLGGGLAVLVALSEGWQKALLVAGFAVVLQQVEGNVIVPRVMRNAVGLTPLTVILALLVGGALLGPVGAVLAIPVAAAVQVLVSELLRSREEADDEEAPPGGGVAAANGVAVGAARVAANGRAGR